MSQLNIAALEKARMRTEPFEYTIVPGFLSSETLAAIEETYPDIMKGGSYPLDTVEVAGPLQAMIDAMDGPEFEAAIEKKFNVSLKGQPKMYSLRGYCRRTDGKIHTDSKDKIITVLLYLNRDWEEEGGKLRMLKSGTDLNDFAEEVPPDNGTLLVFKRSDKSWHGHGPFEGVRRSIQMNWMVSESSKGFHAFRHRLSAKIKKLTAA
jgi:SM-20-related protein